jgi:hypothetical protein
MLLLPFTSDALDAKADLGRSAVATAIADPLTVTPKKSLLVLIGVSSLLVLGESAARNRQANSQRSAPAYCAQQPNEMDVPAKG